MRGLADLNMELRSTRAHHGWLQDGHFALRVAAGWLGGCLASTTCAPAPAPPSPPEYEETCRPSGGGRSLSLPILGDVLSRLGARREAVQWTQRSVRPARPV